MGTPNPDRCFSCGRIHGLGDFCTTVAADQVTNAERAARLRQILADIRRKSAIRDHFHAGVMAVIDAMLASPDAVEQDAAIQAAQEAYIKATQ